MNNTIRNLIELGNKYKMNVRVDGNKAYLNLPTIHNKDIDWIKYDSEKDTVSCLGNTDQCCIWLCDTRKDFTPEKCIEFIVDLNKSFDLQDEDEFKLEELIDPEDWQVIANVHDAYTDERYSKQITL